MPVKTGWKHDGAGPGAAGTAAEPGRRKRPCMSAARREKIRAAHVHGPGVAAVVRAGIPCRDEAPAVNAADEENGLSSGRIGVNGAAAWAVALDGEACRIVPDEYSVSAGSVPCLSGMDVCGGLSGGKRGQGRQGASGTIGEDMAFG